MKALIAAAVLAASLPAHAVVEDVVGANYSFDSVSNLFWLDPVATLGQSAAQVAESDYADQGWRYATRGEVQALFSNAGPDLGGAHALAESMGGWTAQTTSGPPLVWELNGIYGDGGSVAQLSTATCGGCSSVDYDVTSLHGASPPGFPLSTGFLYEAGSGWQGGVGSFLVSNVAPVPEPETWLMMGIGLAGILAASKRRTRRG